MLEKFYPDMFAETIYDIDISELVRRGIRGMILDIDNTLVPTHTKEPTEAVVEWVKRAKEAGIEACIVSNATRARVERFNRKLAVYAIHRAYKPSEKAYLRAVGNMGCKPDEVAVIGDQLFTDVYGGKKLGMLTILVRPLDKREFFFVRMKRVPEKLVFRSYGRKYGHPWDRKKET